MKCCTIAMAGKEECQEAGEAGARTERGVAPGHTLKVRPSGYVPTAVRTSANGAQGRKRCERCKRKRSRGRDREAYQKTAGIVKDP